MSSCSFFAKGLTIDDGERKNTTPPDSLFTFGNTFSFGIVTVEDSDDASASPKPWVMERGSSRSSLRATNRRRRWQETSHCYLKGVKNPFLLTGSNRDEAFVFNNSQQRVYVFLVSGSPLPDLNRRLFAYHANTLPTELRGQEGNRSHILASFDVTLRSTSPFSLPLFLVNTKSELILPGTRLELVTRGFSVLCSTN